ncbi:glycosyltransferase family 2 protein [Pedobacter sp. N36a]|uniref:glycosyltransferase family 2 protein n=1 Tax=Pedobacter sp. N36a TaxID=2767996 RepID=UPI001657424F|nr:glycosyltransferase family 2 protein [Pedobacter sp. N36a]MBC8985447.1 glycosyltransferase family 2 protein [Pedobacter sp. N36a]
MYISAVIITKNSEKTIKCCLDSIANLADEVLIVDSGSTDLTLKIAESFGCVIIQTPWLGYGATKNLGHQAARFPYILSLDSDEALSYTLVKEIQPEKPQLQGLYEFRRLNNYCGKWIKHGAWYPDKKIRLFPKEILWNHAASHEKLVLKEGQLLYTFKSPILHYAYSSEEELKSKVELYARLGVKDRKHLSKIAAIGKMIFSPMVSFVKSYFIKRGFQDGMAGLKISYYIALGTFLKYKYLLQG